MSTRALGARVPIAMQLAVLAGCTVAIYVPALRGEFLFDDFTYIVHNPWLTVAPGLDGLAGIWLTQTGIDYYALTHTSFWLDWQLWGDDPTGYHVTNVALHVANSLLVWRLLAVLGVPGAFVCALLFALHPVNVQAVAWITQRKTLLAAFFGLATLLAYRRFEATPERHAERYAAVVVLYLLALLSKISVIVVPALLWVWIVYRTDRLGWRDVWPTLPLAALAVLFAANGVLYESSNPMSGPHVVADASLLGRAVDAGWILAFYAKQSLWPHPLVFIYPRWEIGAGAPFAFAPHLVFAAAAAAAWHWREAWGRHVFAALAAFAICLAPVLGFVDFGHRAFALVADPYLYLSLVAVTASVGGYLIRAAPRAPAAVALALAALCAAYAVLSWRQAALYVDRGTVWRTTLERNPRSWHAHNNLGSWHLERGELAEARRHYAAALALEEDPNARANLALAQLNAGEIDEAETNYRRALETRPDLADAHMGLGRVEMTRGSLALAEPHLRTAVELQPGFAKAHANLAAILDAEGRHAEAIDHYRTALALMPDAPDVGAAYARSLRARAAQLARSERLDEAVVLLEEAVALSPDSVAAHQQLADALAAKGDGAAAAAAGRRAAALRDASRGDPRDEPAR